MKRRKKEILRGWEMDISKWDIFISFIFAVCLSHHFNAAVAPVQLVFTAQTNNDKGSSARYRKKINLIFLPHFSLRLVSV